ncbi:unnamed protein product [Callosobruchus maculatus]|uniref:Uncharacterized protein n=1 Tax=Callosobruchus maculatus TaxID=64391 RepID=A0A653BHK1_CALMS|nr:unnamed protein product [Callosobruchus maculatus]
MNGENGGFANLHSQLYGRTTVRPNPVKSAEDDLGFDPIQETQKAFAELMATEQTHKTQHNSTDISNTCNDWKVLDPAILSSSRHYPLAATNLPPQPSAPAPSLRDNFQQSFGQPTQQSRSPLDYQTNSTFSNFLSTTATGAPATEQPVRGCLLTSELPDDELVRK